EKVWVRNRGLIIFSFSGLTGLVACRMGEAEMKE
ncbi:MAG: hypothetical protein ACI9WC_003579, partial [Arenicella sp.]